MGRVTEADLAPIIEEVSTALSFARGIGEMRRDQEAREVWHAVYEELSEGKPGLLGAMIARAEAQVMRLACIYALLDRSPVIRKEPRCDCRAQGRAARFTPGDGVFRYSGLAQG